MAIRGEILYVTNIWAYADPIQRFYHLEIVFAVLLAMSLLEINRFDSSQRCAICDKEEDTEDDRVSVKNFCMSFG